MVNNSIYVLEVYKDRGAWVFDDDRVNLVKEPFVAGADTFIDRFANGSKKVSVTFSTVPFPDHSAVIEKLRLNPIGGTDYTCNNPKHDLWLCPALNLYYPVSPDNIYVKIVPIND